MGIKSDMNKIPSLLTKALNFQSKMKSVLGGIQGLIEPYIDLSDYDGDKEDFLHNISIVETTDGFCFVIEMDDGYAPHNVPVEEVMNFILQNGKIMYSDFNKISI